MNYYIDIGINLTNRQFHNDKETIIQKAIESGVRQMILTGTSVKGSELSAKIALHYPTVLFSTAGIHPHEAKHFDSYSIASLQQLLQLPHVVAVGECGLDFDRDFSPRPLQEKCYQAQLELAIDVQKPLFLHERAAFTRFMEMTLPFLDQLPPAVVHCFTGTLTQAKAYLDKGFYLGFTGAITDKKRFLHLEEVLKYVPLDRIMIETDAPFMQPKNLPKSTLTKYHERRNEPAFLEFVAQHLSLLKNVPMEALTVQLLENTRTFFTI